MNNQILTSTQSNHWTGQGIVGDQKKQRSRFSHYKDIHKKDKFLKTILSGSKNEYSSCSIGELLDMHLKNCPESKVMDRKNSFISFCEKFATTKLNGISVHDLKRWFQEIQRERDYSDLTLSHIRGNLNHFFYYLVDEGIIMESPLAKIKFDRNPPPKRPRVFLTMDEIKTVLESTKAYSPHFLYPLFYALAHTGARRSEVMNLKWSEIDLLRGTITFLETKNGTHRTIKLSPQLLAMIQDQPRVSPHVFTNPLGKQIGRSQLSRHILALKAHYPFHKNWNCHTFRHSFAYNHLKTGVNMYELQALMGHKSIQLTIDLYGKLLAEDVAKPSPYNF
ncbi:MAG TPA: tyrosine-type recombinase/integrase [Bacteriovoracaceae bacterium]|nr:tyrosine-type recombinase/integrase [Bacteriovoracaceae bacterium]